MVATVSLYYNVASYSSVLLGHKQVLTSLVIESGFKSEELIVHILEGGRSFCTSPFAQF